MPSPRTSTPAPCRDGAASRGAPLRAVLICATTRSTRLIWDLALEIRFTTGVRLGRITLDPTGRVIAALWTHRPARRAVAQKILAAAPLAQTWRGALALPFGRSVVAMGQRLELLRSGYGDGGAAVLSTEGGQRILVVGPTTESLEPRHADRLVMAAPGPATAPADWLSRLDLGAPIVVPDAAAAQAVAAALADAEVPHLVPAWMRQGRGRGGGGVRVTTRGDGQMVDLRPQADEAWQVEYARAVAPELVYVHGPRAEPLAAALVAAGLDTRVLQAPTQLVFAHLTPPPDVAD